MDPMTTTQASKLGRESSRKAEGHNGWRPDMEREKGNLAYRENDEYNNNTQTDKVSNDKQR
jgi:hypothetical protein